jgi:hypothetical protein
MRRSLPASVKHPTACAAAARGTRFGRRSWVACWVLLLVAETPNLRAQAPTDQPVTIGDITVSGSVRARSYSWDWFGGSANGDYTYPAALVRLGLSKSHTRYDWQAEFAIPVVLNLPTTAIAPAPQGQLGLGAAYFAANDDNASNAAALFLKQGFVRLKNLGGVAGQSLKIGRIDFNDGTEVTPKDATLAALKRDRISQRLLGNFGFSDVQRSFDGAQYGLTGTRLDLTGLVGRPTQGVFQVNGWPELDINVFYGALTGQIGGDRHPGEWRVFGLGYDDYRDGAVKTDNRSAAMRSADTESIAVGTYGGHYLQVVATSAGPLDFLAWGAAQTGAWGVLTQRAGALAVEIGWQLAALERLKPWVRAGYNYGSGDHDPGDDTHGTFFQVLPTARIYARLPFFNMMNSRDAFGELILRPAKSLTVRTDVHALQLADRNDLWYSGGGAFQPETFGYTGRPANGRSDLATLYDVSGDFAVNSHLALGVYYGRAVGQAVTQAIYAAGDNLHLGYAELLLRF